MLTENSYVIIPARLESTRLPNKLLLEKNGFSVLDWAISIAAYHLPLDRIILATDSKELFDVGNTWGIITVLTGKAHSNGTSRVKEAAKLLRLRPETHIVNLQADV